MRIQFIQLRFLDYTKTSPFHLTGTSQLRVAATHTAITRKNGCKDERTQRLRIIVWSRIDAHVYNA